MKNKFIHVCSKTGSVDYPSTESRRHKIITSENDLNYCTEKMWL
jgi:hypothetical protein